MCTYKEEVDLRNNANRSRIFENQHLLDATEIFRKLNVHKKVRHAPQNGTLWAVVRTREHCADTT
jgi:hypothetical protein